MKQQLDHLEDKPSSSSNELKHSVISKEQEVQEERQRQQQFPNPSFSADINSSYSYNNSTIDYTTPSAPVIYVDVPPNYEEVMNETKNTYN